MTELAFDSRLAVWFTRFLLPHSALVNEEKHLEEAETLERG